MRNSFSLSDHIKAEVVGINGLCEMYGIKRRTAEIWMRTNPPPHFTVDKKRLFIRRDLLEWKTPKTKRG